MQFFQSLDIGILLWLQQMRCESVSAFVSFYTSLGNLGLLWLIIAAALLCRKDTRRAGIYTLCAMAVGMIFTNLTLKPLIARTRPWVAIPELTALIVENDPLSFPSGHTCAAFASAVTLCWALPKKYRSFKIAILFLAVFMGFSRLYVGVHYPSDVLAGAIVGTISSQIVYQLARSIQKRNRRM